MSTPPLPLHRLLTLAALSWRDLEPLGACCPRPGAGGAYRWSCNAQVLVRWRDRRVVATSAGGPGNRNDPLHFRGSEVEALCLEHRRVLADGGYRGVFGLRIPVFRRNTIVRDRAWRRHRRRRARVEHVLARLKDWRVLHDHRRRSRRLAATVAAVAVLHDLKRNLWDSS